MARQKGPNQDPQAQAKQVVRALARLYPEATCALHHRNPYELLVATILSAQCTDARVNLVTPALFESYPDPASLAAAEFSGLERMIHSTGFFRAKARNLVAMAQRVTQLHGGKIPVDLEALTGLPGVGRKTANVVLGTAFGIAAGVVVDTHVKRLAKRLGLSAGNTPEVIERDLMASVPKRQWVDLSHRLIIHGRKVCAALKPRCDDCGLNAICPKIGVRPARNDSAGERPVRRPT